MTSHELAHQWFGDLVTCKDWANLWLNEGFADYFQRVWNERRFGADDADFEFWRDQNIWNRQPRLFPVPIVSRDFDDSTEYQDNIYDKAGWVLRMLHEKLGDEDFYRAMRHYLEANRGQNVVTADLQKAIEQATVNQRGQIFRPMDLRRGRAEIHGELCLRSGRARGEAQRPADAEGRRARRPVRRAGRRRNRDGEWPRNPFDRSQRSQPDVHFSSRWPPAHGDLRQRRPNSESSSISSGIPAALTYQLKNAETTPDRAEAAVALGSLKGDPDAVAALGDAAQHDPFWGVRVEALQGLGRIGGPDAEKASSRGCERFRAVGARGCRARAGEFQGGRVASLEALRISRPTIRRIASAPRRSARWRRFRRRMLSKCSRQR